MDIYINAAFNHPARLHPTSTASTADRPTSGITGAMPVAVPLPLRPLTLSTMKPFTSHAPQSNPGTTTIYHSLWVLLLVNAEISTNSIVACKT